MAHRFHHIAGARFALGTDHGRAFAYAPQSLAQIARSAHERHPERVLVGVEAIVRRGQHFTLVDIVHAKRLKNTRLDHMPDPRLGHDRNADSFHDAPDNAGIRHTGHAPGLADVGGHALQRHHRTGPGFLCDFRLFRGGHIHDDPALEHLRQSGLKRQGSLLQVLSVFFHMFSSFFARMELFLAGIGHAR